MKTWCHFTWKASSAVAGSLLIGFLTSGCSSGTSTSRVTVGAPVFSDVNGAPLKTAPTSLNSGQSAYLEVTLANDPQVLGADWSVYCGSAPPPGTPPPPGQTQDQSCGTFTPVHTMSGPVPSFATGGSGYVTLYTAPAAPPVHGTVTLYASATSNPSRWSSVTLSVIGLPIAVSFAPPPPASLATGASTTIKAVVNNDIANAGVVWTTICAASDCGSFNPTKSASGATTSYTAPAAIPDGGAVQVIATSVTDPTKAASATISISAAAAAGLSGRVQAFDSPVSGAEVSVYAVEMSGETVPEKSDPGVPEALATTLSDDDGNFAFRDGVSCPTPDSRLYLVARGGNAGRGTNPNLVLLSAAGDCSKLVSSRFIMNEATTVAAVYALSAFITGEVHPGSTRAAPGAIAAAFSTASDLVDPATGLVRSRTVSGAGIIPAAKLNTLANMLGACARTAGSSPGDGSPCDQLFAAALPEQARSGRPVTTFDAILALARDPANLHDGISSAKLYSLASSNAALEPVLLAVPRDWSLSIVFPAQSDGRALKSRSAQTDDAGNIWILDKNSWIEFVGGARCAGAPESLATGAADGEQAP